MIRSCILLLLSLFTFVTTTNSQQASRASVVSVKSGSLKLRAQVWRPKGRGPFPAVLFCTGSGQPFWKIAEPIGSKTAKEQLPGLDLVAAATASPVCDELAFEFREASENVD